MSSGVFQDYFGRGLLSARPVPATLAIPAGTGAQYWATDTSTLYELNLAGTGWTAVSGGGGGGGGAGQPSTLIQIAYARSAGGGTITLPAAPTVGNIMVLMQIGGSNGPFFPASWEPQSYITETNGMSTGQKFWLATKPVLAGETGVVNFGGGDFGNLALFELDALNLLDVVAVPLTPQTSAFSSRPTAPRWGSGLRFFVAEHDQSDQLTFGAVAGLTVLQVYGGSSNHRGSLAQLTDTFAGAIQVQTSGGFTWPTTVAFSFGKF